MKNVSKVKEALYTLKARAESYVDEWSGVHGTTKELQLHIDSLVNEVENALTEYEKTKKVLNSFKRTLTARLELNKGLQLGNTAYKLTAGELDVECSLINLLLVLLEEDLNK